MVRPGAADTVPLRGAGLVLVPVAVEHAVEMAVVLADPALYDVIGGGPPSVEQLEERYRRQAAGSGDPGEEWHTWVVADESVGCLVGYVQATLTVEGVDGASGRVAELAWVVGTPWQGWGVARRAAGLVLDEVRRRGVATVVAHVAPGHRPSEAVAASLGLRPTDVSVDDEVRWVLDPA